MMGIGLDAFGSSVYLAKVSLTFLQTNNIIDTKVVRFPEVF